MRLQFEISELALSDLESIWNNTAINWSSKQANKYYDEIIAQIDIICDNPRIGRSIAHIKKEHRRLTINSHIIIYKVVADVIFIDRILHKRMDVETKLGKNKST